MERRENNEKAEAYGKLFLLPVGLGNENPKLVLPAYNLSLIGTLNEFIVENSRSARRFLRKIGFEKDFDQVNFHVLNKHTTPEELPFFLTHCFEGKNIGLLSEAGNPCIADPGNKVVKLAHENEIQVIPLTGPSSILQALIASGFNGQHFVFHGYLPIDKKTREHKIKEMQNNIIQKDQTQIFMETPYRNNGLVIDLITNCHKDTLLCIASNITLPGEFIKTMDIGSWQKRTPDLHKQPSVFLLYKNH